MSGPRIKYIPASWGKYLSPAALDGLRRQGWLPVIINDVWIPHLFHPARIQIWYGGSGSSKSDGKATELLSKCMKPGYCRVMFCRKTATSIRKSQFQLLKDLIERYQWGPLFHVVDDMVITCKATGNFLFAQGLDDLSKVTSVAGVTDIWIEEPIPKDNTPAVTASDFRELNRRLRCPLASNHIHMTFNPISDQSWINDYFFKSDRYSPFILKTTYQDNYYTPENEALQYEILRQTNPDEYEVYALGNWGKLKRGLVFPEYRIIEDFPPYVAQEAYGMDWGFYPDPCVLAHVGHLHGKLYVDELIYQQGLTSAPRAELMRTRGVPDWAEIAADNNPEAIEEMRQRGFYRMEGAKKGPDSVKAGIDIVKSFEIYLTARSTNIKLDFDNHAWEIDPKTEQPTGKMINKHKHCFVAGQMVFTSNGYKAIEKIGVGEVVLAQDGWRSVLATHQNKVNTGIKTYRITSEFGEFCVTCTIDHKININDQWQPIQNLKPGDRIFLLKPSTTKFSIFTLAKDILHGAVSDFTGWCGSITTGQSQRATTSTTSTKTGLITGLKTLPCCPNQSIFQGIRKFCGQTRNLGKRANAYWTAYVHLPHNGTKAKKVESGTGNTHWRGVSGLLNMVSATVSTAITRLWQRVSGKSFAPLNVPPLTVGQQVLITKKGFASFAPNLFRSTDMPETKLVACLVREVCTTIEPLQPVYDITVEGCHNYIVNGLLVHNSADAVRYGTVYMVEGGRLPAML